ncbi:ExbD/TolR family protein [Marinomonas balearica]|uniref:Biopolymer transport protein ExbD n=1 Tax=Marinomonas balearica TaxID=491947 RepID=A0A4R6M5K6_9GAMM|nr:biopolymer transporter ExbD [Marinomonas balearica]TDO95830.1 biopolymer transport protein ExbD [Marinomonas balearica]
MPLNLEQTKRKTGISLTPLIDVVFILLLFFMLTSSFVPWRIVDTPLAIASSPTKDVTPLERVVFTLESNDGYVLFENKTVAIDNQHQMSEWVKQNKDALVVIHAKEGVTLQSLMTLADQLKKLGAAHVSIANAFSSMEPK